MRRALRISTVSAITVTGWLGGMVTERYRNSGFFGYVANAKAGVPLGPEVTPPISTTVPGKDTTDSYPFDQKQNRTSQIMRFGFPSLDNIRSMNDFVLSYDRRNRVPAWVFEHLTRHGVKYNSEVDRNKCDFFEDHSVHPFFRATNNDYRGSGYDRGHLAAAGNHRRSQSHCSETFILSNMAPQVGKGFNRDTWNRLEKHVRGLTKHYENLYVCTGPLYLPRREADGKTYVKYEVIGSNSVAVPTHFFKIIVLEETNGVLDLEAYLMPNAQIDDRASLSAFQVPVEAVERAAGLIFFDRLPRNAFRYVNGKKTSYF